MQRPPFLSAAALTPLSTDAVTTTTDTSATQRCDICGGEKPAEMVERTTVKPIAPREADICWTCQHVHDHDTGDGRCLQCGEAVSSGFHLDIAFPLGVAELPGTRTGHLCGDCAGRMASEITYSGVEADDDAQTKRMEILDEETERMNAARRAD